MDSSQTDIWSVTELNQFVSTVLRDSFFPFWLRGEISNLTLHPSGHVYLTLKDSHAQVSAVMWRGVSTFRTIQLKEGDEIEAFGNITVFEPRGTYQFAIQTLRRCGLGALRKEFEEVKKKLALEGAFDPNKKRPIPKFPQNIGLITSDNGAAIHDFITTAQNRHPGLRITLASAAVQGNNAVPEIIQALRLLNRAAQCDVIVITRGGGSAEDLQPFNSELLARAILASAIPVISAIGHEVDTSISDLVADLREATPTAAAKTLTEHYFVQRKNLQQLQRNLTYPLLNLLRQKQFELSNLLNRPVLRNPFRQLEEKYQQLDETETHLTQCFQNHIERKKQHLTHLQEKLVTLSPATRLKLRCQMLQQLAQRLHTQAQTKLKQHLQLLTHLQRQLILLSPKHILDRGYAVLTTTQGQLVSSAKQLQIGEKLIASLQDGKLQLTLDNIEKNTDVKPSECH